MNVQEKYTFGGENKLDKVLGYDDLIKNIKKIIKIKGMKQGVVAERAGFTPQEFSNILNGRKLLRAEYLLSIANSLGVEVNDLYGVDKKEVEWNASLSY